MIALAERFDLREVAALDRRDFLTVAPRHLPKGQRLTLLPANWSQPGVGASKPWDMPNHDYWLLGSRRLGRTTYDARGNLAPGRTTSSTRSRLTYGGRAGQEPCCQEVR